METKGNYCGNESSKQENQKEDKKRGIEDQPSSSSGHSSLPTLDEHPTAIVATNHEANTKPIMMVQEEIPMEIDEVAEVEEAAAEQQPQQHQVEGGNPHLHDKIAGFIAQPNQPAPAGSCRPAGMSDEETESDYEGSDDSYDSDQYHNEDADWDGYYGF